MRQLRGICIFARLGAWCLTWRPRCPMSSSAGSRTGIMTLRRFPHTRSEASQISASRIASP